MSTFHIKIFAIIAMLVGHVGFFFFPENSTLFLFGRLSFPLFAWLVANGARHTRNIYKYAWRLLIFALISQLPFILANQEVNPTYWKLNVLFTLLMGLLSIIVITRLQSSLFRIIAILLACVISIVLQVEYSFIGILSMVFFYIFYGSYWKTVISQTMVFSLQSVFHLLILLGHEDTESAILRSLPFALLSLLAIRFYTRKEGKKLKYAFYAFYPLHFAVLYFILKHHNP